MKTYLVQSKPDDYGACLKELVQTTERVAKEYYHAKEVDAADVEILKKYFDLVPAEEESERTCDERYFGSQD